MLTYERFVDGINTGKISSITFEVEGYAHYKNCTIKRCIDVIPSGKEIVSIKVQLTPDKSEIVSFLFSMEESYKLFKMGRKGSFTLKQMWGKIKIIGIE